MCPEFRLIPCSGESVMADWSMNHAWLNNNLETLTTGYNWSVIWCWQSWGKFHMFTVVHKVYKGTLVCQADWGRSEQYFTLTLKVFWGHSSRTYLIPNIVQWDWMKTSKVLNLTSVILVNHPVAKTCENSQNRYLILTFDPNTNRDYAGSHRVCYHKKQKIGDQKLVTKRQKK